MISFEEFKKLELRIAEIKTAEDHPNADKLTVIKIDVGGEEKQIVAGIKGHYANEELVGKKVVVVNNLEPAAFEQRCDKVLADIVQVALNGADGNLADRLNPRAGQLRCE